MNRNRRIEFWLCVAASALAFSDQCLANPSATSIENVSDDLAQDGGATISPGDTASESSKDDTILAMPLEDLLTLETTSVARKRQSVANSAAAVHVITQEDITRSAASSIPELLRMAPGIEVAQIQNGEIGVTARGFNSPLASNLLVLIDGRAVYFSSLSGVLWSQQLLPLSEIERIEIVRGPGATLWGSNAVNGVINIISKHASSSRGLTVVGRAGDREQSLTASYNGILGESLSYRLYGHGLHDKGMVKTDGNPVSKDSQDLAIGGRLDFEPGTNTAITLQADYSTGKYGELARLVRTNLSDPGYDLHTFDNSFGNFSLLARLTRQSSERLDFSAQVYVTRTWVRMKGLAGAQTTVDGDAGVRWSLTDRHEFNLGISARVNSTKISSQQPTFRFQGHRFQDHWLSSYAQYDFWLMPDKFRLTLGSKFEFNDVTGFELQPSAKLLFRPAAGHTLWAGVSRTSRTPSIYERTADFYLQVEPGGSPVNPLPFAIYSNIMGCPVLGSEHQTAYELGLRGKLARVWTYDVSWYLNDYRDLTAPVLVGMSPIQQPNSIFQQSSPYTLPAFQADLQYQNSDAAKIWGIEALVSGAITPTWRIDLTYSHLHVIDPGSSGYLMSSPANQFGLRSSLEVNDRLTLSAYFRHVDKLVTGAIPAYQSLDLKARYQFAPNAEISLIGKNLLSKRHAEYFDRRFPAEPAFVPRSVSVQLTGRI